MLVRSPLAMIYRLGCRTEGRMKEKHLPRRDTHKKPLLIYECNTWKVLSMQIKAALEQVHFIAPTFVWQVNHTDADTATPG